MKINYGLLFKELIESEGYELLSEYNGALTKVEVKCSENHIWNVRPNDFKNGIRCPNCPNKRSKQAKEHFFELLHEEGYELIDEYTNNKTKVSLKCPLQHEYSVTPNHFKKGVRCPKCTNNCTEQSKDQFKKLVKLEGYTLLNEYKNTQIKIKIKCDKGHIYNVKPNHFKNGSRCPKCSNKCLEQAKEQFFKLLEKEGYDLLSEYIDTKTKVKLKCPEDHIWDTVPSSFKYNYVRCPHCEGSTGQRKLQSMLEERGLIGIYNDREILNGLELDIYYPDLNIGIEYQGNYWHSLPEHIERDKRKKLLCKEKGIKLIEVWDDDFRKNSQLISENIHSKIMGLMTK